MIARIANYFSSVSPMFIDGMLYTFVALFAALTASLSSDEAAKYIGPATLFWLRTTCGAAGASFLAMKMFRSTQYKEHQDQKIANATGEPVVVKPSTNPEPEKIKLNVTEIKTP